MSSSKTSSIDPSNKGAAADKTGGTRFGHDDRTNKSVNTGNLGGSASKKK